VSSLHRKEDCVLCRLQGEEDAEARILLRTDGWYVVLNRFPYTTGHMMVVARRHVGSMAELEAAEAAEQPGLLARCEEALRRVYRPHGLNMGLNLGRAAGAGVEGHLHWHVLPRWEGDANFVSVVGDTRVLPETLDESFERLQSHFTGEQG
jgi:ATP adenylyltransferase